MSYWQRLKQFVQRFTVALTAPNTNVMWQVMHVMLGALVPALCYLAYPHWYMLIIGSVLVGVVYGFPKEFWIDIRYEGADKKEGWDDLYHLWAGSALALLIYGISRLVSVLR